MDKLPFFIKFEENLIAYRQKLSSLRAHHIPQTGQVESSQGAEKTFALASEIEEIFRHIKETVRKEYNKYLIDAYEQLEKPPDNVTGLEENLEVENVQESPPGAPTPPSLPENKANSPFLDHFLNKTAVIFPKTSFSLPEEGTSPALSLTKPEQILHTLFSEELENVSKNRDAYNYSASTLQKIKKAILAIEKSRIAEAITVLRGARREDPGNHTVSFLLSQLLYYQAYQGKLEVLPEAREESKRSCAFAEKFSEIKLLEYRYHVVSAERYFSDERALEQMREYYLLNPESVTGKEGLYSHKCIHLKCWALLATISLEKWSSFEINSLLDISQNGIGGSLLYLTFFRTPILQKLQEDNSPFEGFRELENMLGKTYTKSNVIKADLQQNFSPEGLVKQVTLALPWMISSKYLRKFLSVSTIPTFDEILLYTNLSGKSFEPNIYPDAQLHKSGLVHNNYWKTWAVIITPFENYQMKNILPYQQVVKEAELLSNYETLLKDLKRAEKELLDPDNEGETLPPLPTYAYDNLLEIGTGKTSARSLFAPKDPFFRQYFRTWGQSPENSSLPSELIEKHAVNGGFCSLEEIQAAFDGAHRLLFDPVHGLPARIQAAQKKLGKKTGRKRTGTDNNTSILAETWWLYLIIAPVAILTFYIVISATTTAEALKSLAFMMGGIIVVVILFWKIKNPDK